MYPDDTASCSGKDGECERRDSDCRRPKAAKLGVGESLDYHTIYNTPHNWRQQHLSPVLLFG